MNNKDEITSIINEINSQKENLVKEVNQIIYTNIEFDNNRIYSLKGKIHSLRSSLYSLEKELNKFIQEENN